MTEEEQAQHDGDYQSLLALYIALLKNIHSDNREESLYALAELRTDIAFQNVIKGLGIDYERALALLQGSDDGEGLTKEEVAMRDRLLAAIRNLIDFSVCEEYQLYDETLEAVGEDEVDFNSEDYEDYLALCEKYNDMYAAVENGDIRYAGAVAAMWMRFSSLDYVVYWTQNDSKVRPWHLALQGYSAPMDEFPSWMIPPIEYNCRCFLTSLDASLGSADLKKVKASSVKPEKPIQIDDVYGESLAKCGRIFGPSHSYFSVRDSDRKMLDGFVLRLKEKYYGKHRN